MEGGSANQFPFQWDEGEGEEERKNQRVRGAEMSEAEWNGVG